MECGFISHNFEEDCNAIGCRISIRIFDFLGYFVTSCALLAIFCFIYLRVTPYPELRLIKEGKCAPALSFGGAVFGFVIPLASAIAHSISFLDMFVWALVALVVQILVFLFLKLTLKELVRDIADDRLAPAIVLAIFSTAAGLLNAASMSW